MGEVTDPLPVETADADRKRRQRARSIAIALVLAGLVVLFYVITIIQMGSNAPGTPS